MAFELWFIVEELFSYITCDKKITLNRNLFSKNHSKQFSFNKEYSASYNL
jgi:hypothetical protein